MSLTTNSIEKKLRDIESAFFQNQIIIDDIQVWPIIKDFYYSLELASFVGKKTLCASTLYKIPKLYFLKKYIWNLVYNFYYYLIKLEFLLNLKKSQFLFLDVMNKEYLDKKDNAFYSKYISPYFSSISAVGKTTIVKLTLEEEDRIVKKNYSFESKYILKARKYFYLLNIHKMYQYNRQFAEVLVPIDRYSNDKPYKYSDYASSLSIKLIDINFYKEISFMALKKVKPKSVFIETYFGHNDYYGAILSAKKLNIPVIDIQHGNSSSFMYRGYDFEINSNKCVLPDYYWVWSKLEYDYVLSERPAKNVLMPILLGKHFFEEVSTEFSEIDALILDIKKKYSKVVLITFQYNYRQYEFLKNVISDSKDCFFLFRFHPLDYTDPGFREYYINYFSELVNIEYEMTTKVSINALFKLIDLHLTLSSAAAIDALNFNVKTILLNKEYAETHFKMYYNKGVFLTFENDDELKKLILITEKITSDEMKYFSQKISNDCFKTQILSLIESKR